MKHGLDIHSSMSLEDMLARCREIDPRFNDLNLSLMYSTKEEEDVWMDMATVKEYIAMAQKTQELIAKA